MSIVDGQRVNALNSNNAWVSKTSDSTITGKITLSRVGSGASITDAQLDINQLKTDVDAAELAITGIQTEQLVQNSDIDDLQTLSGEADDSVTHASFSGSTIPDGSTTRAALQSLETAVEARILLTEKGAANGVATLDAGGKIPTAQLPSEVLGNLNYQGTWNASTNTPSISDAGGSKGHYYVIGVAGTQDLGSGSITYDVGDWVVHNGSIFERLDDANINSVNGYTGTVVLDTDDVSEGSSNLYFTNTRADTRADLRIAASSVDALADVDTTTNPPAVDQALVWDGSNWIPQDVNPVATNYVNITNLVINGGFDVWTGTSSLANSGSQLSRIAEMFFTFNNDGETTTTQQTDSPTDQSNYSYRIQNTTSYTAGAGDFTGFIARIEGSNFLPVAGKQFTISFRVKSSVTGTYCLSVRNGASNRSYVVEYTINVANTWELKTITLTHDTTGTWDYLSGTGVSFTWSLDGGTDTDTASVNTWLAGNFNKTANQVNFMSAGNLNATWQIGEIMLCPGPTPPTDFTRNTGSINGERDACLRYYELIGNGVTGGWLSTSAAQLGLNFKSVKRTNPSIFLLSTTPGISEPGVANRVGTASTLSLANTPTTNGGVVNIDGFTGATANRPAIMLDDFLEVNARLY